jgi:shikimate dehydrogenase
MSAPLPKLAGVCGWPIHHSLSPLLHNYWLRQSGLRGAYVPFMVKPWEAERAFRSLKKTTIAGVNVTLPLKVDAFRAADDVTEDAQRIGAANCLYVREGRLIAHNTDLEGFAAPLLNHLSPAKLQGATALVIGAGGAAKAVIGALLSLGLPEIIVTNRTDEKAENLAKQADLPNFYAVPWANRQDTLQRANLVVNASSAGMVGYPALALNLGDARAGTLIYDLIYTPEVTPLLAQAKALGLPCLGGLDMLIAQARPSFRLFFDKAAPVGGEVALLRAALQSGRR